MMIFDINDFVINQAGIKEAQQELEAEMNARDKSREQLIQVDRRANSLNNELEECKSSLELADRSRRNAEQELSDVLEQLSDQTMQNQSLLASKRKLESEMQTLHVSTSYTSDTAVRTVVCILCKFELCIYVCQRMIYFWMRRQRSIRKFTFYF